MARLILFCLIAFSPAVLAQSKMDFWAQQRKGSNCFNKTPTRQWFADAAAVNIRFVRLTFSKWEGEGRDFLLGNADHFEQLSQQDLQKLKEVLRWADEFHIKVVVVPLSLPGARWSQQNAGKIDRRLWEDFSYHQQSAQFWKLLAAALKDDAAVVGYEILNEPSPERALGEKDEWQTDFARFKADHAHSPADLDELYAAVIPAIRAVDPETPIILSCGFYGFAGAIQNLTPVADAKVIYTFHTYEPYAFTNYRTNAKRYAYPGKILTGSELQTWNLAQIREHVSRVNVWAMEHRIPASRIWVGEFGCDRRVRGASEYLADAIRVFNRFGWHWSFYSFREDEWDAMDYECGDKPLPWSYWQAIERGEHPPRPRKDNPLWDVLKRELQDAIAP